MDALTGERAAVHSSPFHRSCLVLGGTKCGAAVLRVVWTRLASPSFWAARLVWQEVISAGGRPCSIGLIQPSPGMIPTPLKGFTRQRFLFLGQISKKAGKAAQISDHQKTTTACCVFIHLNWLIPLESENIKKRDSYSCQIICGIYLFLTPYLQTKKMKTTRMVRMREIICRAFIFIKLPVVWRDNVETNLWTSGWGPNCWGVNVWIHKTTNMSPF